MMHSGSTARIGGLALCLAASALAISACSKKQDANSTATTTTTTTTATNASTPDASTPAATPASAPAPAASDTATVDGTKLASFTGDAAKGKTDFITCQTCHSIDPGVNKIGPSLHGVVGRKAGSEAGFSYSAANKNSGITWTEDKLFQYLEHPQRVVPGTKMTYTGFQDPQKRADVIAYLKSNS